MEVCKHSLEDDTQCLKIEIFWPLTYHTPDELVGDAHLVAGLRAPALSLPTGSGQVVVDLTVGQAGHGCQGPGPAPSQPKEPRQGLGRAPAPSSWLPLMSEPCSPAWLVLHRAPLGWTLCNRIALMDIIMRWFFSKLERHLLLVNFFKLNHGQGDVSF